MRCDFEAMQCDAWHGLDWRGCAWRGYNHPASAGQLYGEDGDARCAEDWHGYNTRRKRRGDFVERPCEARHGVARMGWAGHRLTHPEATPGSFR